MVTSVRVALVMLIGLVWSDTAAQTVDWRRAGGDLFGRPPEPSPATDEADAAVQLAALDQPFQRAIQEASAAHGLDPKLLHALVIVESAYRPDARSPIGAAGLTQLMPATAVELGSATDSIPRRT